MWTSHVVQSSLSSSSGGRELIALDFWQPICWVSDLHFPPPCAWFFVTHGKMTAKVEHILRGILYLVTMAVGSGMLQNASFLTSRIVGMPRELLGSALAAIGALGTVSAVEGAGGLKAGFTALVAVIIFGSVVLAKKVCMI